MKRFFILATCAVLLFACSDDKKDEPKTTENTMSADADKDKKPQQSEFADPKYVEFGKKMQTLFQIFQCICRWKISMSYQDNPRHICAHCHLKPERILE